MFVKVRLLAVRFDGGLDGFGFFLRVLGAFRGRVFVSVGMFHPGLLAGLHCLHGPGARVFAVVLLLVDDFLVVGNVAWIGHRRSVRRWLAIRLGLS